VIVVGNHDNPLSFGKANTVDFLSDLPFETFHIIAKPAVVALKTKQGPINIVGIPWPTRNMLALKDDHVFESINTLNQYISTTICAVIQQFALQLDPHIPAVLSAHLTVDSGIFSGSEKRAVHGQDPLFMPSDLAIKPFDYVALGHLHRFQQLNEDRYPAVVYAGSPERIDFGERKEEKGFCLVTIHEKGNTTHEFIATPQRPFIQIEVSIKHEQRAKATQCILDAVHLHTLDDAIVKIMYYCDGDEKVTVDLAMIQRACARAHELIGIFPVCIPKERTYRGSVRLEMDFIQIMKHYCELQRMGDVRQERLLEKALQLQYDIAQEHLS
jgi:DNA repair protein SbcD/Mre11